MGNYLNNTNYNYYSDEKGSVKRHEKQFRMSTFGDGVYTFGSNNKGKLGLDTTEILLPDNIAASSASADIKDHVEVAQAASTGGGSGDAIDSTSTHRGTRASQPLNVLEPRRVMDDSKHSLSMVAAGGNHTLVLTEQGMVYSWGMARSGQLGHRSNHNQYRPKIIEGLLHEMVTHISVGALHSIVCTASGSVYTFGSGEDGRLGHGNQYNVYEPRLVDSMKNINIIQVAAGGTHSVILADQGTVFSFGRGAFGQLGHNITSSELIPKKVEALENVVVTQVAAGGYHTIAMTEQGTLYSFGFGRDGQLGHRSKMNELRPRLVEGLTHELVVQVAASGYHSIALTNKGEVYTFGQGWDGQLGHSNSIVELKPKKIVQMEMLKIIQVAAGNAHSILLTDQGHVYTFGKGESGQLGHSSINNERKPKQVMALAHKIVTFVSAGDSHTAVITATTLPEWSPYDIEMFDMLQQSKFTDVSASLLVMKN